MNKKEELINPEKKKELLDEIKSFFLDERSEEIGDLQAELLCDLFVKKISTAVYNQALSDARHWFRKRLEDLESDYFSLEREAE